MIATGETGSRTGEGEPRAELALARLFGIRRRGTARHGGTGPISESIEESERHTYLRLLPEGRAGVEGPHDATAPDPAGERRPVLDGFELTDTLPFGGCLPEMEAGEGTEVLATFVPDFPIFPPETSWMRRPRTDLPAILARKSDEARLVWFAADIDRCLARDGAPDHARLIRNAVRWCLRGRPVLELEGAQGFVMPSLFRQGEHWVLHLNNRLVAARVPGRQSELVAIGPVRVSLRCPLPAGVETVDLRVAGQSVDIRREGERWIFEVPAVRDHEVAVIG